MPDNSVALLCTIHPATHDAQRKVLSLLRVGAREYYTLPTSHCTTWSYFTPYPPSNASTLKPPIICGLEMYTTKSALQQQIDDKEFFQKYHDTVRREGLYGKEEELQAWYFREGFMSREGSGGRGRGLVSLTRLKGEEGEEGREEVLRLLRDFITFVREKEQDDVLTYALFTRPKAPREVLVFVRYRDWKALRRHADAAEHVAVAEKMAKLVEGNLMGSTTVWQEVEDSFVSLEKEGSISSDSKL